jgi:hypothetical protein
MPVAARIPHERGREREVTGIMRDSAAPAPAPDPNARALLLGALATLALTAAHHAYGAIRYDTPWRLHGAIVALGMSPALLALYLTHRRRPSSPAGRAAGWGLAGVILAFPVLVIGAFEGVYNHLAKDALFLAGAPRSLLLHMFPPPAYEMPNDAWFEVSGVLQVIPAAFAGLALLRFVRALRAGRGTNRPLRYGVADGGGATP